MLKENVKKALRISSSDYDVKYLFKEYNSTTDSLLFNLKDGNNNFIIKYNNLEYKLHFFKNYLFFRVYI